MIHPLLVHLPIGIILLAVCFEWLERREKYTLLYSALPFIWRLGAAAAIISAVSGWFMRRSGTYAGDTIDYHQCTGIITAVMTVIACFLPYRRWWGTATAIFLGAAGYFGAELTHGENFLSPAKPVLISTEIPALPDTGLPDTTVAMASQQQILRLKKAGLTVFPVAQGSPWLSVSFVNQYTPGDSLFQLLELIGPQVTILNLSGVTFPGNAWQHLAKLPFLSSVYLNGSTVKDDDLQHFAGLRYLKMLNLSHTALTPGVAPDIARIKGLKQVYLYQTQIQSSGWPTVFAALPGVKIDTGNYVVPTLSTDTIMLKSEKKY